jgi:autonomous glycyl radical cofactor GrcA
MQHAETAYLDTDFFRIIVQNHTDVINRMSIREYKEKVAIVNMAMNVARNALDETDKCHHNSPIERLMWVYLAEWISEQKDAHLYKLYIQYHLDDNVSPVRDIDLLLQYDGCDHPVHVAIEVDGKDHLRPEVMKKDALKDKHLWDRYNVETVRVTGIKVFNDKEYCMRKVERALNRTIQRMQGSGGEYTH